MATSFYFNNFQSSMEQMLYEDLVVESIKIHGNDMYYLPRTQTEKDDLYGTDDVAIYEWAIPVEFYIKSVDGFEGDGTFLSKFNVEVRDEVTLSIALRTFDTEVVSQVAFLDTTGTTDTGQLNNGPRQGDLIYMPLTNRLFQVSYVDVKPVFFQLGAVQFWDLKCHLYEYSGEIIETNVPEIQAIVDKFPVTHFERSLLTESNFHLVAENGLPIVDEEWEAVGEELQGENFTVDDADVFEEEAVEFLDFSETNPFADSY